MTLRPTGSIFIVDDNDEVADLFATLLRFRKYEVHVFYSAKAALQSVFEERPGVIFSDLDMPDVDGFEFAVRIRKKIPDYYPVMVALSGWRDAATVDKAFRSGFDFHVPKPIGHDDILNILGPAPGI